jgi:hypothetical protein
MSSITRKVLTALVASTVAASAAVAQGPVNYSTSGQFSGGAGCSTNVCSGSGFTLTFNGASTTLPGLNANPFTFSSLGMFNLTGTGTASGTVLFNLMITQTTPSGGTGNAVGNISGTVTTGPGGFGSTLIFSPNSTVNIGDVTYVLQFDQPGGITIANNGPNTETTINARITAVPEPATVILMGSGLAALGFFGARRKKA